MTFTKALDILAAAVLAAVAVFVGFHLYSSVAQAAADQNALSNLTVTPVWIGKDLDILTVATNTARTYLELQNMGATSSTAVYCQINDKAGAVYTGFVIAPTSTRIFDLDALYRGALRCRGQSASTTLFILEN